MTALTQYAGFVPQAVAQTGEVGSAAKVPPFVAPIDVMALCAIPWGHHLLLMERVKDLPARRWYMAQTATDGWSRSTLALMIDRQAHARQGRVTSNFATRPPPSQSDLVFQQEIIDHIEAALSAFRDVAAALPQSTAVS